MMARVELERFMLQYDFTTSILQICDQVFYRTDSHGRKYAENPTS